MEAKYNLSSQEYEIMSILWKENREMTLAEIAEYGSKIQFIKPGV